MADGESRKGDLAKAGPRELMKSEDWRERMEGREEFPGKSLSVEAGGDAENGRGGEAGLWAGGVEG